ncbi:rhodanese-like domain-containing protein [Undibacterium sp. Jales W-56]|uniref:rhodanese-like domain-containing protein n=1 Tax=Undibacterium sp. Jales W-56 TaxID=2897325 RepID=UPI0021D394DD|nr:rhodanese-like domain-containing protein [Undibacterium sp. Jales W-56]MCU6434980.1 rhodanese-like domain-containing protein [Undibacterium sp. Jales W-56]
MKFFIDNIWIIGLALISGGALLFPALQRRGAKVSQLQATQLINQGKTVVLDVRDAAEFATGHLQNAKNIPLAELPTRLKELEKSKNATIITVCERGIRSATAAGILNKAGFEQVVSLEGGVAAWKSQGLPTVKQSVK